LRLDNDTYKRLADNEYFDWGLIETFEKTSAGLDTRFSGDGTYIGKMSGDGFGGGDINISCEGETGLTRLDLIRVELAEQYLAGQNLFTSSLPDSTAQPV
jgi:hypothetical protein